MANTVSGAAEFLQSYLNAWNQGRPDDLAAFFAPNGDLIAADGTHLTDRAAIAEYYRQALSGPYGSLRLLNFKLLGSCQISAGVSVIDGTWEVHAPAGAARASAAVASPIGTFVVPLPTGGYLLRHGSTFR